MNIIEELFYYKYPLFPNKLCQQSTLNIEAFQVTNHVTYIRKLSHTIGTTGRGTVLSIELIFRHIDQDTVTHNCLHNCPSLSPKVEYNFVWNLYRINIFFANAAGRNHLLSNQGRHMFASNNWFALCRTSYYQTQLYSTDPLIIWTAPISFKYHF